jgi:hypothetical protein
MNIGYVLAGMREYRGVMVAAGRATALARRDFFWIVAVTAASRGFLAVIEARCGVTIYLRGPANPCFMGLSVIL